MDQSQRSSAYLWLVGAVVVGGAGILLLNSQPSAQNTSEIAAIRSHLLIQSQAIAYLSSKTHENRQIIDAVAQLAVLSTRSITQAAEPEPTLTPEPIPTPTPTPEPVSGFMITEFVLIDADTDQPIKTLADGDVVSSVQRLNIEARTSGVARVVFYLDGQEYRSEGVAPFAFAGDVSGDFNGWGLGVGAYTVSAVPYDSGGVAGPSKSVTFEIE